MNARLNSGSRYDADGDSSLQAVWEDGERVFSRGRLDGYWGGSVLTMRPAAERPSSAIIDRLTRYYDLKDELDSAWAVRPLQLVRERGRTMLVLEDPGGEPLVHLLGAPMELESFLRLAIGIAAALGKAHQRGLVHKDLKPAHILVNCADGLVRLTGFGIATRLPRQRQSPDPPETIAGTLAYMAPEQTGRMNRSIDSRSDLYSLGVTLYQMLTGSLPFSASDPLEWVHCHIARQPLPPGKRLETVPAPVSQLVMKLLAKTAEQRYQTAAGLERDLRRCLTAWEAAHRIDDFPLGEHDTPDRLLIPEKLYGRAREIEILVSSFNRIVRSGAPELVLVSGYSGIGKSSVVNELHKMLAPPRGLFASGKFDQYKRDIPYSTLAQAFQGLVRTLLGKSQAELARWRDALLDALGPNARLMVDLVPGLDLIIGNQPPVPALEPQQAQSRFQLVFRRFIDVFARPEHPLALFLDDLQWLDAATLDLLEDLLTRSDLQHLMLIGAYRDNEVDATHPLTRKLDAIRRSGARVQEIRLAPLARADLGHLIAEALHCEPPDAEPLAQLAHEKTDGNPFFVIQFLHALADEGLLTFDYDEAGWSWDIDRIQAKGYTDNVVDLMLGKLARLPSETQHALQQLACLGNVAATAMLSIVLEIPVEQVHAALWPAVRQELVERPKGSYKFVHDRVQEAAYSLIPEASRAASHLQIGRLLLTCTPPEQREAAIFEIVNQLNRGAALIAKQEERDQLAELNLIAGKRAKGSTAYASALTHLNAGAALLNEDIWERRHELIFALELNRAECEFLTGALARAEQRLAALSQRAATTVERSAVACLRVDLYTTLDEGGRAIAVGLEYLRHHVLHWSPHPTEEEADTEYRRIWLQLGSRPIEALAELPLMSDAAALVTLDILTRLLPSALFADRNLFSLIVCKAVNLCLERGNSDASCVAYVRLGMIAGPRFGDYEAGLRFGRLGYELVEKRGLLRFQAATYMLFGANLAPWTADVRSGRELLRRSFHIANKTGDLTFAAFSRLNLNSNLLAAGDPLDEVEREIKNSLEFAQKVRFGFVLDIIGAQLAFTRTLRGLTPRFGYLDHEEFDESRIESRFSGNKNLARSEWWYWIRKLQARFLAGDYAAAIDAESRARRLLWTRALHLEAAEYHLYGALARAASCDAAGVDRRQQHLNALADHHRQLAIWAEKCPENFENRAALVGAEIARLEGRELDAERLYQQAIRSARSNGFVHNEAIACEVAARFYATRDFEDIARLYLTKARDCYLRWGADGKVRQLDALYRYLTTLESTPGPTSTIAAPVERLDLATVIKVSQAVSGEMVLEKLIDTLMRTAITQAGAERGILILSRGAEPQIAAEAATSSDGILVELRDAPVTASALPETVVHYVLRTSDSIVLDDAATDPSFAADPYIRDRQARSILCLPLINRGKLTGVLYLENNLTPRAFAPARIAVLTLLASQAAISLENTRLYRDLAEREAKIRRLVDANIIGIVFWDVDGRILDANDAYLRIIGYEREDLIAGRIRWTDLTPPEWRDRTARTLDEMKATGIVQPYEKEYFRKDGGRVRVLLGGASLDEAASQGVTFALDLTERKRAEQALRDREAKIRSLFDANIIGISIGDIAGQVIEANDAFLNMLGYDRKDLVAGRVHRTTITPPEWRDRDARTRAELETAGTLQPFEKEYFRKDGSRVPVLIGAAVFEPDRVLAFVLDLTERKRVEEALRESEEQWKAVFENNPTMYFMVDASGAILSVNPYGAEQLGFTVDELIGRPAQDLFHLEDREAVERNTAICFKQRGQTMNWEARKIRKNGGVLWVREVARVMLIKDRPVALIVCEDITERKCISEALREVELALVHANRVATMGQLTASIAHEVNHPIATARNNAASALWFLSRDPPDLEEVREALECVINDADRAGAIVNRIRAHVKGAAPQRISFDISDAVNELMALARSELEKNGVTVRLRLAEGLASIRGDRVQVQQVLLNLILNAVEAMNSVDGGARELSISAEPRGADEILVVVRDSGPGLDPERRERVFDSFYTTKPAGMGLGLSICRSIVEAHGGRLWAGANEPGGATFQFTLPAGDGHS